MDLYYAIINDAVVGLTWADDREHALTQVELALAEDGIFDTGEIDINRMSPTTGTLIINTLDQ